MGKISLQETLKKNREMELKKDMIRNKNAKRENIKETILASIILVFIIGVTVMLLASYNNTRSNAVRSCVSSGHSEIYCQTQM